MNNDNQKSLDEVLKLLGKQRVAMVTTHQEDRLVARPMGMQQPDEDGTLWFFCRSSSDLAEQVRADARVNVALADGDYLSVSGRGDVIHDPTKNKELWGPFVDSWMQCEPDDPECCLVKVTPDTIGYWDTPSAAVSMIAMVGGMIANKEPDIGESGVVQA